MTKSPSSGEGKSPLVSMDIKGASRFDADTERSRLRPVGALSVMPSCSARDCGGISPRGVSESFLDIDQSKQGSPFGVKDSFLGAR